MGFFLQLLSLKLQTGSAVPDMKDTIDSGHDQNCKIYYGVLLCTLGHYSS